MSAKSGDVEQLKETLYKLFNAGDIQNSDLLITNQRHLSCLRQTADILREGSPHDTLDVISSRIRRAWEKLGEITGTDAREDVINNIYSKFCLGK